MNIMEPRFEIGKTFATSGVTSLAERLEVDLAKFIWRHHCGDWGDLCQEDKQANEDAIEHGLRIVSSYKIAGKKIYVITEHDRSMTTVMLANEY